MKKKYFIMGGMLLSSFLVLGGCGSSQHSISIPSTPIGPSSIPSTPIGPSSIPSTPIGPSSIPSTPIGPSSTDFHFSGTPTAPSFSFSDVDEGKITDVSVPISLESFSIPTGANETSTLEIADTTQNIKDDQKLAISPATLDIDKPGNYNANIQLQKNTIAGVHTITFTLKNRGPQGKTYTKTTQFTVFNGPKEAYNLALTPDGQNVLLDGVDAVYYSSNGGDTLSKITAPADISTSASVVPVFAFSGDGQIANIAFIDKDNKNLYIASSSVSNPGGLGNFNDIEFKVSVDQSSQIINSPFSIALSDDGLTGLITVNTTNKENTEPSNIAYLGEHDQQTAGKSNKHWDPIHFKDDSGHDLGGPFGDRLFAALSSSGNVGALSSIHGDFYHSNNIKNDSTFYLGGYINGQVDPFNNPPLLNQWINFSGNKATKNLNLIWQHHLTTDKKNHLFYSNDTTGLDYGHGFTGATTELDGDVISIATSPNSANVVAITEDSIWYSKDHGKSYQKATLSDKAPKLGFIKAVMNKTDGNNVVLITTRQLLYSTDGGQSFTLSQGDSVSSGSFFTDIAISGDGKEVLAIARNNSAVLLFKSTDSGANFTWTW